MSSREEILRPYPEKDPSAVRTHPNPTNSAIFVYKYGRLEKIEPATPENLNYYQPDLPPEFFEEERVNAKAVIDRALPEGKFASGASPHIQVVVKKALDVEEGGGYPSIGDFYNAIAKEYQIEPEGDGTRKLVSKTVESISGVGGPGYLIRHRDNYRVGNMPPLSPPLVDFRKKVNPHQDQIVSFLENRDMANYESIRSRIMGEPLKWTTNGDYFEECLEKVIEKGCVDRISDNMYKFVKKLPTFGEEK